MNGLLRRHYINMLYLWNSLISIKNVRLTKRIFHCEQAQNNQLNWTSQIRNVMEEINIFVILQFVINNTQKKKDRSNVETA